MAVGDIVTCNDCGKPYDASQRKYRHSCPYCCGDVGRKPGWGSGWKTKDRDNGHTHSCECGQTWDDDARSDFTQHELSRQRLIALKEAMEQEPD